MSKAVIWFLLSSWSWPTSCCEEIRNNQARTPSPRYGKNFNNNECIPGGLLGAKKTYNILPLFPGRLLNRDIHSIIRKHLVRPSFLLSCPSGDSDQYTPQTIVTGRNRALRSLSLSSASPEEGGIMETMKRSRRKDDEPTSSSKRMTSTEPPVIHGRTFPRFYISNTHAKWL
jgi:hypothetical protein